MTREEVSQGLSKCKNGVSSGLDGATFEGLKMVVSKDDRDRIPAYFTEILQAVKSIPDSWMVGKIVLLPKVPRQPICGRYALYRLFVGSSRKCS